MEENIKKKHHYVSQTYLNNWKNKNDKIWTFNKNLHKPKMTPISESLSESIAYSNHLYKINGLNEKEYIFLMKNVNSLLGTPMGDAICNMIKIFRILDIIGDDSEENSDLFRPIRLIKSNSIENIYCLVEGLFPKITKMIAEDPESIEIHDYEMILRTVSQFFLRNLHMKNVVCNDEAKKKFRAQGMRVENIWPIMALIKSEIFCMNLIEGLYEIDILKSEPGNYFITNDKPILSLNGSSNPKMELLFPISPNISVIIVPSRKSEDEKIRIKQEWKLNKKYYKYYLGDRKFITKLEQEEINDKIWGNKFMYAFSCENDQLDKFVDHVVEK
ncbi:hypothetical protein AA103196_0645 [Ameyamaea chiangmaiensis NBRC 103196]|uniref:DUF4238 domain-containing protein n=1 Tax=Ameyamaea chiangmaiensis TaxID=442969 RepID=A0A850P5H9_9PROT|nr:DUF4238 domain-containing protein [Ameyamaea chiangmaiensis]MBS4076610.1 DUF4238 domain-containing protein [Ameyamaea chiangmaiensis]NVN39895.1 DUF4238 domain-containing protein [Ameyamaea chiangmaiensis]GBQ63603.1 hypothetical protein AA103196_0645 [Ameyamaea chiangmaiensis NBRC 103196]